ncbi:MAG: hypothetical protein U9R05_08825 [Chloroflexota bacterium]|nr:hypothetical protein [Chloroflexota bacterium]
MDGIEAADHIHQQMDSPVIYLTVFSDEGTSQLQNKRISSQPYPPSRTVWRDANQYLLVWQILNFQT